MSNFKIEIGNWIEYWADASADLPSDPRQTSIWTPTNTGTASAVVVSSATDQLPNGAYLGILTGSGETYYFSHTGTSPFARNCSNVQGYTMETKIKVKTSHAVNNGHSISWSDDKYSEKLFFNTTHIKLNSAASTYVMDTTDEFHRYRITVKDTTMNIYVDDALVMGTTITSAASTLNAPVFNIGDDYDGASGSSHLAYFKYNTDGAYSPDEDWRFDKIDLSDKRSTRAQAIIRSHNSIIEVGKMGPAKIKLSGTVAGSCYDSFRDTVRRLKKLLMAGNQHIYIDDERYIMGLHNSFALQPITTDYAKFSIGFDCRQPFYQNLWAEYFSTAPASAATFYVINNSDVETPLKVIITGAASGTIANSCKLLNVTTNQTGQYTGILAQTQELIIDKGFDDYNTYKVLAGSNAHASYNSSFGSYEGDLFTLKPGGNTMVFVGGSVGTIEMYWRDSYLQ